MYKRNILPICAAYQHVSKKLTKPQNYLWNPVSYFWRSHHMIWGWLNKYSWEILLFWGHRRKLQRLTEKWRLMASVQASFLQYLYPKFKYLWRNEGREGEKKTWERKKEKIKKGGDKNRGVKRKIKHSKADKKNNKIWKEEKKIRAATHFNYFFFHDK